MVIARYYLRGYTVSSCAYSILWFFQIIVLIIIFCENHIN